MEVIIMENFVFHADTEVFFGKNQITNNRHE